MREMGATTGLISMLTMSLAPHASRHHLIRNVQVLYRSVITIAVASIALQSRTSFLLPRLRCAAIGHRNR
jgi:hypothetical protein